MSCLSNHCSQEGGLEKDRGSSASASEYLFLGIVLALTGLLENLLSRIGTVLECFFTISSCLRILHWGGSLLMPLLEDIITSTWYVSNDYTVTYVNFNDRLRR
jgi:hypothetical protein